MNHEVEELTGADLAAIEAELQQDLGDPDAWEEVDLETGKALPSGDASSPEEHRDRTPAQPA